ncbi:MAG: hypothetical protein Q8N88_03105 [Nanoarchaeota archaeon]|nr:hypothetical protein [Nanoarchaeota archaeon]
MSKMVDEQKREREIVQDVGECELYNFLYTAKYGTGSCWVDNYESLKNIYLNLRINR